ILPAFTAETGITVDVVAVGTGQALQLGEDGNADVLLVHARAREDAFMEAGHGVRREDVMYNDFVIVGPASDPAGLAGATGASDALQRIADSASPFVSRGDDSGTHALEKKLWASIDLEPDGSWYTEAGSGMGDTLNIANEREAYTISDRGTFLALKDRLDLGVLVEGDPALLNIYHVILTNPDNGQHIDTVGGEAFLDFLLEPSTQEFIGTFGVEEFGEPLFTPCADNSCGVEPEDVPAATPES
ncbi:MAG: substrate-binding domain-containing protein, partial [Thermomicrobiales bacterium]|nr:substrate-binding domain-containing protein [Thermomicrobiales bacterium]